jgi:hypothetical protein
MIGINTLFVLALILASALAQKDSPIRDLINQKAKLSKLDKDGKTVNPVLKSHGTGITDGEETLVLNYIDQAEQRYGNDIYQSALFLQQKVEDSLSGRWVVEIFGGDPSWGRATHIRNDQWILFFGFGTYSWDYIIWAPEC